MVLRTFRIIKYVFLIFGCGLSKDANRNYLSQADFHIFLLFLYPHLEPSLCSGPGGGGAGEASRPGGGAACRGLGGEEEQGGEAWHLHLAPGKAQQEQDT